MKKPIFTEDERRLWCNIELEIAKLRFKRDFERSILGKFLKNIVETVGNILYKYQRLFLTKVK